MRPRHDDAAGDDVPVPDVDRAGDGSRRLGRRRLLQGGGLGGALLLGGAAFGRSVAAGQPSGGHGHAAPADDYAPGAGHDHGIDAHADLEALGLVRGGYGHGPQPPRDLDDDLIADLTHPPAADPAAPGRRRELVLPVTEGHWSVADGATIDAWMYGGRVPGPVLRATVGDRLRITVDNRTGQGHNLHLHGSHDPQMDGWEPIPPGGSFVYDVEAGPVGLHPYHCHLPPYAEHVRRGLHGVLVVDPARGREPAVEVVLVLDGFDLTGNGRNDVYAYNGVCGLYDRHPVRVPAGDLVRVYLVNFVEGEPLASFHLHAQTFDVYLSGTGEAPDEHTDVVSLGQGERAMLEFRLPTRGRYMFHPHQHHMAERGAMGWFTAI
ncbi:multicopper oxidase domain-containing protein [Egicoccus sp. AB-alg6-2]|uniref:multicopper oxidase domain-containing protein n=1 Tax=Egicoccus sp. AB-alg6-2 TaxID=3242692 RepID=UPI00359D7D2B